MWEGSFCHLVDYCKMSEHLRLCSEAIISAHETARLGKYFSKVPRLPHSHVPASHTTHTTHTTHTSCTTGTTCTTYTTHTTHIIHATHTTHTTHATHATHTTHTTDDFHILQMKSQS